jgi:hypothetical protein
MSGNDEKKACALSRRANEFRDTIQYPDLILPRTCKVIRDSRVMAADGHRKKGDVRRTRLSIGGPMVSFFVGDQNGKSILYVERIDNIVRA